MYKLTLSTTCLLLSLTLSTGVSQAESEEARHGQNMPAGYDRYAKLAKAPYDLQDLETLKKTVLFTSDDVQWLRKSRAILAPQADDILDVWYGFVGSTPHLLAYFANDKGKPDARYLKRVRARFRQWILDTAAADYDQQWLNYQYEIGLRHHRLKKNQTDKADAINHIPARYVLALVYPITATLKPFLAQDNLSDKDIEAMHQAWSKSLLMQAILWTEPYFKPGDF